MSEHLLIVDDEARMGEILAMVLRREGYAVTTVTDPEAGLALLDERRVDLVLTDLKMPGLDGLEILRRTRAHSPDVPVLIMTAFATIETAVSAIREGAFDYIQKPFDNEDVKRLVRRALEVTRLGRENQYLRAELKSRYGPGGIVAESPAMRDVLSVVRRVAPSRSTVLITGESGTGKELVARSVHYHSDRVGQPFVAVNLKALAPGVVESELFGHEKGAFTGALKSRPGLFERADGGTLFLDELGEIEDALQAKLLRVLQEREVQRVGGDRPRPLDVRLVAATNRVLETEVAAGRFREDLYFRLAVIPIHLSPLRERIEDILPLARHFLERFRPEAGRRVDGFSEAVREYLVRHDWPGNVRELENAVERGVVLARGPVIELEDVLLAPPAAAQGGRTEGTPSLQETLDRAAAERLRQELAATGGVKAEAARRLGIDRTTLYRLMHRLGLE